MKLALEGVEKERDFYFGKLREIEVLCQEHGQENDDLVQRLMEVLYASDEQVRVRGHSESDLFFFNYLYYIPKLLSSGPILVRNATYPAS